MSDLRQESSLLDDDVFKCNRCGFCNKTCPTYQATGLESMGPRGRNIIIRAIAEGDLKRGPESRASLSKCLLCGACESACFPGISTDRVVLAERDASFRQEGEAALLGYIFDNILSDHKKMGFYFRLLALGRNLGLASLLANILGRIYPYFSHADKLLPKLPSRFLREELAHVRTRPERPRGRVGYFVGCGMNFMMPQAGLSTVELIVRVGYEAIPLDNCCCGLVPYTYGNIDAARRLALKNLPVLADPSLDVIVTDCASCASFLSRYEELGLDFPKSRVMDITGFLSHADIGLNLSMKKRVTYHDPCHLKRYLGIFDEPRELIKQVAEFSEMQEADLCCGGAGTYSMRENEISTQILERKTRSLESSNAEILTSACPSCLMHLKKGISDASLNVKVIHISSLLAGRL